MTPDEIVERAIAGVKRAAGYCDDVEFSPEDACRTEYDFLCRVVEAAIDAGATTINIPDTVGYVSPGEVYDRFKMLRDRVPNIDRAVLSTHCHDDLGSGRRQQFGLRSQLVQDRLNARSTASANAPETQLWKKS